MEFRVFNPPKLFGTPSQRNLDNICPEIAVVSSVVPCFSTAAHPTFDGVSSTRLEAYNPSSHLGPRAWFLFFLGPQFFGPGFDNIPQEKKKQKKGSKPSLALLHFLVLFAKLFASVVTVVWCEKKKNGTRR
ncbi:hypothetical protein C1H46_030206 [Malus baccata]|uniref:Transmembrane protein n=1 Tax=Malus baccata TaxID=106549 RepID=A0A540LCM5_MALBA|nr:hypothetical protein C1H46_030206 [Malus baccata]